MSDGRALLLSKVTEHEWQRQVEKWAKSRQWRYYHTWNSQRSVGGFPDLVLVRGGRLIFAELKTERGKLSQVQHDWLSDLLLVPCAEVHCWRPTDEDAVKAVLA